MHLGLCLHGVAPAREQGQGCWGHGFGAVAHWCMCRHGSGVFHCSSSSRFKHSLKFTGGTVAPKAGCMKRRMLPTATSGRRQQGIADLEFLISQLSSHWINLCNYLTGLCCCTEHAVGKFITRCERRAL